MNYYQIKRSIIQLIFPVCWILLFTSSSYTFITNRSRFQFSLNRAIVVYDSVMLRCNEFQLLVIGALFLPLLLGDGLSCADHKNSFVHRYHPIRHCQKSNKTVVGLINVNTVEQCADFASKRRAMAFNFAPAERGNINLFRKLKGQKIQEARELKKKICFILCRM